MDATSSPHEDLLRQMLDQIIKHNRSTGPGTPMAELKDALESALAALPPLEFEEFERAINDTHAAERLVRNAPEIIGWNADQIVQWVEELSKKT